MKIIYEPKFINQFNDIWDYISKDSQIRANNFKLDIKEKIEELVFMPYKFRKSIYFNDEDMRDLIYKGYVIPYKIDTQGSTLLIIGITKYKNNI